MSKKNLYLERYAHPEFLSEDVPISPGVELSVVIPCHNEPELLDSLKSLANCERPDCDVEVIVVINQGEGCRPEVDQRNRLSLEQATQWKKTEEPFFRLITLFVDDMPKKTAGVGLARKIGMDEAVRRFEEIGKADGIIVCFDADSLCQANYLCEIRRFFQENRSSQGCSIHYEHPLSGGFEPEIYKAIADYELHLRYYTNALRWAGHPHAYQTIGSSMAVRNGAYQKQGGMNKRKAGEDFYFLQKIIPLGHFKDLCSTMVIPSPRPSDRVPFGTGRAISEWLENKKDLEKSYHPEAFDDLKSFFARAKSDYQAGLNNTNAHTLPQSVRTHLGDELILEKTREIYRESKSMERFEQKFFAWFNAFAALKFVHFYRDSFKANISLTDCCDALFSRLKLKAPEPSPIHFLKALRRIDKEKSVEAFSSYY